MKKILITTGGTGGHVIPAEIIEEHLKDNFKIYYTTDLRGLRYLSSNNNNVFIIDTPKFTLNLYLPFKLLKLIFLVLKATFLLKKKKIEKVISIGGYMSLPVIIGAKILGLTIFLIEPNLVLGRANRLFLNYSKKIICYSNKIINFPNKDTHKVELIKPLVSKVFYQLNAIIKKKNKFCFLIFGGSQGAKIFDELIKEVMLDVSKNFSIEVIQQTSKDNIKNLKYFYDSINIENKIFSFEKNFVNLINKSDLCISRAGATSLAEISILKKPFVAIPLPSAKDDHQLKNAEFYLERGCCWILEEKKLTKESLSSLLLNILKNKNDLDAKISNLEKFNYENSWNNINQKIQRIINEN